MFEFDEIQKAEILNLFHLGKTTLAGQDSSNYQCMLYASREYNKKYPNISKSVAYKNLTRMQNIL